MLQQPPNPTEAWYVTKPLDRALPPAAAPMAEFRFAYATPGAAFAAQLSVPANTAAGVALVIGVVVIAALIALSA